LQVVPLQVEQEPHPLMYSLLLRQIPLVVLVVVVQLQQTLQEELSLVQVSSGLLQVVRQGRMTGVVV
jgi:hypothetical protein